MSTRELLMIPGPVEYLPEVLQAVGERSGSHVGREFIARFGCALKGLREIFRGRFAQPLVLAGSGTLAMELAAANLVEPDDEVLVVNTGYFSDRMGLLLERHGARVTHLRPATLGEVPPLGEIDAALAMRGRYKLVTVTQVDTSTGVLAPVEAIARRARAHGALILVDAVCAAAGEELRQDDWGLDAVVTASQKALGVPPGLAIASIGPRALEVHRARRSPVRAFYCDWSHWLAVHQAYERGELAYFATPPLNLINALQTSVGQILAEGMEKRATRHRRMAQALRAAWRALQLEAVPRREAQMAHTMSALYYPAGLDSSLLTRISEEGVVVAGGLHPALKARYFRVGHMGAVGAQEILATAGAVGTALAKMGARVDPSAAVAAAEEALERSE
ncbi:MAG: alanine--glyoxylate aminotransferase family protein [Deltaproteobacteria bacterium]|nr:alanine--glyoxylate aminotransferase family protein [Deltaproteobacteria bacterium]